MSIEIDYSRAISNMGNSARIKEVMKRAQAGEDITVAFLGGSITQGSLSSTPELCYAYRVYKWWCETFPKAKITYVNAGIGATDSQFGCARAESDVLRYKPDFMIIEYSVNDASNDHYLETYESLVRKCYYSDVRPAVLLVHNVCYDSGANAERIHAKVARYYDIPSVTMRETIYPLLLNGVIENREITPDDLHPNDTGHELVASVITHRLTQIRDGIGVDNAEGAISHSEIDKPVPFTANAYENSVRYRNDNAVITENTGWTVDTEEQKVITDIFKNGWTAKNAGAKISFEVEGSCIAVQYRRTIALPAPIAKATVDGDTENARILDANFDETWGDKLCLDTLLEHGDNKKHVVEVELIEAHEGDKLPFYLVSVIGA